MNKINPKVLMRSKWTKMEITNKEKHFIITKVNFDEQQTVVQCVIEAVMTQQEYEIDWRELKYDYMWKAGWQ